MTDDTIEKKDVEETTEESEIDTETNDEIVEDTETVEETENESEDSFDYDAELDALKAHKKHNSENAKARIESKKGKKEGGESSDNVAQIIRSELQAFKSEFKNELVSDTASDTLQDELSKITNPKKRDLVKYHFENSIVKSGTSRQAIQSDLRKALAITDASIVEKRKKEISESNIAKETIGKGASIGGQPSGKSRNAYEKVLNSSEIAFGKKRNWTKEMFQKAADLKLKRN